MGKQKLPELEYWGGMLDVSRQTIDAIETEKYVASLPPAFKITALFGCKIEDIFQPDGEQKKG